MERYSRQVSGIIEITARADDGDTEVLKITSEHPIHVEGWDGRPRGGLLADLGGFDSAPETTLFPGEGHTKDGQWIKAGAIKAGDKLTAYEAKVQQGPPVRSDGLLVEQVNPISDSPVRVFNLSIESRVGEITHNYLVGNELVWVHNHGNRNSSPKPTVLYKLFCNGVFMKWGISSNVRRRYSKKWLHRMGCEPPEVVREFPSRKPCRDLERRVNKRFPGPWNRRP